MEFYRPTVLDSNRHSRDTFDCGEPSMDEWLRQYAGQNRRGNTAAVWIIADAQLRVSCFATLSMTSVDRSASPKALARGAPDRIPALLVGRLATDVSVAGYELGTQMVKHILATAVELNEKAACKAVAVTALNRSAYGWWQRFGFAPFGPDDDTNLDMYLLTKDIAATLSGLG